MEGRLDIANFKTCLMQSNIGLSMEEFNQFIKLVEVDSNQIVDYVKFVDQVNSSCLSQDQRGGLQYIADKIKQVLKEKRFDFKDFFIFLTENRELSKKYSIDNRQVLKADVFGQLLAGQIFPKNKQKEVLKYTYIIDVDKDGYIDQYDLETFLGRYGFFESLYVKKGLGIDT